MKHPMQYIENHRFVENKLISWMVDKIGLNEISIKSHDKGFNDDDDYDQLLQLTGYSTSGIPYRDKDKYLITDNSLKPEDAYEKAYKKLKSDLVPIVSDLYDIGIDND